MKATQFSTQLIMYLLRICSERYPLRIHEAEIKIFLINMQHCLYESLVGVFFLHVQA